MVQVEIVGVKVFTPDPLNIVSVDRPECYNVTFLNNILLVLNDNCDVPTCIVGDFNEVILCKNDESIC